MSYRVGDKVRSYKTPDRVRLVIAIEPASIGSSGNMLWLAPYEHITDSPTFLFENEVELDTPALYVTQDLHDALGCFMAGGHDLSEDQSAGQLESPDNLRAYLFTHREIEAVRKALRQVSR